MPVDSIYKFPVPKLANGTQATTATDPTSSTIDNIRTKYAEFFGTTGSAGLYGSGLKEVLDVLKTILDGNGNINSADFSKTMAYLKGSSFYTEAQTMGGKRIDENCREGFLAYRYYLKTIAGIVSNIYSFLEAGRTALAALDGATDSDKAHVLIIQLEIYEKFIYEAFQSLCTYYQYNADMKQWEQVVDFDINKLGSSTDKNFTTQLSDYSSYNTLSDLRATQINCIDSKGTSTTEGEPKTSKIKLDVFNSISLLDRLRYIRYYYKLIFARTKEGIANLNSELIALSSVALAKRNEPKKETDEKASILTCFNKLKDGEGSEETIKKLICDAEEVISDLKPKVEVLEEQIEINGDLDNNLHYLKDDVQWAVDRAEDITSTAKEIEESNLLSYADKFKGYASNLVWMLNLIGEGIIYNLPARKNEMTFKSLIESMGKDAEKPKKVTDYSVFPEDANTGYPCRPDEKSTEATKDTRSLGALEMFYVGYLIDRDGPINAVASFFEVKVAALRNNLSLLSKKIAALNTYLDFINHGMDLLNQSQSSGGKKRIPDGSILALTYLCGKKMYNLFEASNGNKYVVIPSAYVQDEYILVRADESGKRFLMGDCGTEGNCTGNGSCGIVEGGGTYGWLMIAFTKGASKGEAYWGGDTDGDTTKAAEKGGKVLPRIKDGGDLSTVKSTYFDGLGLCTDLTTKEHHAPSSKGEKYPYYLSGKGDPLEGTFKLPTQLEVNLIIPGSVKRYSTAQDTKIMEGLEENEHTAVIESWTNAFSNKTQYINTAIDTINTDVTVDRSKIDTFDSLTSTFRSRAHDAYTNIASNIRG